MEEKKNKAEECDSPQKQSLLTSCQDESYGIGGTDIIKMGVQRGRGVLNAGCVTGMTSSVHGMFAYKCLSANH